MFKSIATVLLAVLLFAGFVSAQQQVSRVKDHKVQIADDSKFTNVPVTTQTTAKKSSPNAITAGTAFATTAYPYFTNSINRDEIVYDPNNGLVYLCPMIWPNSAGNRSVTLFIYDGTTWANHEVPMGTANNRSGWGAIDVPLTGALAGAGVAGVVAHVPNQLFLWDGFGFTASEIEANSDPSIAFSGDNIFTAVSGNRLLFTFFSSADYGITWTQWGTANDFVPPLYGVSGSAEIDLAKSPNEQNIVMAACQTGDGHAGLGADEGVTAANADQAFVMYSTNAGANWTAQVIGYDGEPILPDYHYTSHIDTLNVTLPDASTEDVYYNQDVEWEYYPLFENFAQITANITNNGVVHAVMNGYGQWRKEITVATSQGDVTSVYALQYAHPVIYWNSASKAGWQTISNFDVDLFAEKIVEAGGEYTYPGNAFGQCYPSLGISDDGQVLLCTWSGPEFATPGDPATTLNADASTGEHYTDAYYAISYDGGAKWYNDFDGDKGILNATPNMADLFVHPANFLVKEGDNYFAHLLWVENPAPMQLTDGTGPACDLKYLKFQLPPEPEDPNAVDDEIIANKFSLSQNYPNPFNPTTKISYSIPEATNVTLKVFDMLGREVATLINGESRSAGNYDVQFDASDIASGMYIYKLTAGEFSSSMKMMLLK
ncbi:MAG: T9SS type A sorting domain-containing protein [bacterium]